MESDNSTPEVTTNPASVDLGGKLPLYEKIGYGLGDTASNILYQAWSFFLTIFYTDVFGIDPKVASFMFLVTRVWDMINDPMMGMIADRTNTRWGKFRPYLLWMAVPYGILACAMFITPDWSQNMKVVYAYVTYILATMAYTAINIPYSSLMAVMTPDPKERTTLSQYRFFFAFVGAMLITTFTLPLAKFFGANPSHPGYDAELGYSKALGYQITMGVFGAIAIILLIITFLTTRERVKPPKEQKSKFGQDLKDVLRNPPWIILFIGCIFWVTHNVIRNGAGIYYFDYVYCNGGNNMFTWKLGPMVLDFDQTTVFLTVGTLGMMAGVFLSTPLKKYFGKKPLMIFFSLASVILGGAFYVLPQYNLSKQKIITSEVNGVRSVYAADIDADGDLDALSASAEDDKIAWYQNDGFGNFSAQKVITTEAEGAESVYAADIDADGDPDILSASAEDDKIAWYQNDGFGSFSDQKLITTEADGAAFVFAADLDADGDLDVLSASSNDNKIAWYENDGTGNFSDPKIISTEAEGACSVCAADIDSDGDADVISGSAGDNRIAWYENDGNGNFSDRKIIATDADGIKSIYVTDLDSDKDPDVILISNTNGKIAWYENITEIKEERNEENEAINKIAEVEFFKQRVITTDADGGLFANQKLMTTKADYARLFFAADLDVDGDTDVLSASAADSKIVWNENDSAFNLMLLLLFNFIWSLVAGAMPVFMFAMFSDATDFHEWKFGRRATGLVIAGIMFAIKMGVAIGGFLNLQALGRFGYVANVPQILRATHGIKLLFSLIPASIILVCGVVLFFYPINNKLLEKIEIDLKERKSKE
ncbi:MAG: MFS transporter [Sedimentisphaerales bacterium]|nr:MFS transporter [Sedimentisphaerales bacterium]